MSDQIYAEPFDAIVPNRVLWRLAPHPRDLFNAYKLLVVFSQAYERTHYFEPVAVDCHADARAGADFRECKERLGTGLRLFFAGLRAEMRDAVSECDAIGRQCAIAEAIVGAYNAGLAAIERTYGLRIEPFFVPSSGMYGGFRRNVYYDGRRGGVQQLPFYKSAMALCPETLKMIVAV